MQTRHCMHFGDAAQMPFIPADSVDLVVTSPPYPMIAMWDAHFSGIDRHIDPALQAGDGLQAFERMHAVLDPVWREVARILKPGGMACINIGDAVRSLDGRFQRYPNHSRVLAAMVELGFAALPQILWRKPTNAPNKFMGSGMLPPCAYVTLEHESILIFRKGVNRRFSGNEDRLRRRRSAFFWEERNRWFSDVWMDLCGTGQRQNSGCMRQRSAAFPFEIPYRLILMFSIYEDTVVDPFCGTATTLLAAMAAGRNSTGVELDPEFGRALHNGVSELLPLAEDRIQRRMAEHRNFVTERQQTGYRFRHINRCHGFPVMTGQETDLQLQIPTAVQPYPAETPEYRVEYAPAETDAASPQAPVAQPTAGRRKARQRNMF
ncbi:MAG TPA: DNA-methyltransferase [Desulfobacterales bacterium]